MPTGTISRQAGRETYSQFLAHKRRRVTHDGPTLPASAVHPLLHPWQSRIVRWAVRTRRAAIWADTGLGKTLMQLEWARLSGSTALIVAPLAVCQQTIREAHKINQHAHYVRAGTEITGPGLWVTNYERADSIDPHRLDAVVLDESSILKQSSGRMRTMLIRQFTDVPARLACSATPAPNDPEELTNQAEFLGRMTRVNMLASYFVHDDAGWRLKGHAVGPMIRWMSGWAVALRRPSDIGGSDAGYVLPGLNIVSSIVPSHVQVPGQLFPTDLGGVTGRARVRRNTVEARVHRAATIVTREPGEPWVLWCGLNAEADLANQLIPGSTNVHGSLDPETKAQLLLDFADGKTRVIITKPSIASLGLNWQHCHNMVFVGLGDSYEQYYQCIRRCYRYGQQHIVNVHIVLSDIEREIAANVAAKERQANRVTSLLVAETRKRAMEEQ